MNREEFQSGMEKVRLPEKKRREIAELSGREEQVKRRGRAIRFQRGAMAAAACVLAIGAGGVTVNAATGGLIWETIRSVAIGHSDGPTAVFLAGKVSGELTEESFPEGSVVCRVWPAGSGLYRTEDGTEVPDTRLVFLQTDGTEEEEEGMLAVILPAEWTEEIPLDQEGS